MEIFTGPYNKGNNTVTTGLRNSCRWHFANGNQPVAQACTVNILCREGTVSLTRAPPWLSKGVSDYVCGVVVAVISSLDRLVIPITWVEDGSPADSLALLTPVFFPDHYLILYSLCGLGLNYLQKRSHIMYFVFLALGFTALKTYFSHMGSRHLNMCANLVNGGYPLSSGEQKKTWVPRVVRAKFDPQKMGRIVIGNQLSYLLHLHVHVILCSLNKFYSFCVSDEVWGANDRN